MIKRDTRKMIENCLASAIMQSNLSDIHVIKLIDEIGINRNTFYYYFSSKYDVTMSIFRQDLDIALKEEFSAEELIYAPLVLKNGSTNLAYWTHIETGAHELDLSHWMHCIIKCLLAKESLYRKLFSLREIEFMQATENLWLQACEADIRFILSGRYMPTETFSAITVLMARMINSTIRYFFEHAGDADSLLEKRINPFLNIMQESISRAILAHPITRRSGH